MQQPSKTGRINVLHMSVFSVLKSVPALYLSERVVFMLQSCHVMQLMLSGETDYSTSTV
jgi:hypothetical protein